MCKIEAFLRPAALEKQATVPFRDRPLGIARTEIGAAAAEMKPPVDSQGCKGWWRRLNIEFISNRTAVRPSQHGGHNG